MRKSLALLVGALALAACADDGDHASPDTVIDSEPAAITNAKASFTFHAIGNFSEFLCAFDGEEPAPCISPTEKDLADGNHTFSVAARLLDNFDLTPAAAVWKLDTVPPETTLGAVPPDPDNNATPSIAFTGSDAEGAVTFECTVDGGTAAPCTSPFGLAVADGGHSFTVAAVDVAGNRDATPAMYGWNVNTAAPQTTIVAGPTESQVTAASVSFAFTSPDTAATFECSTDGVTFAVCASPVALTLADGAHTFAVRAVGIAGPDPSPASVGWTVDAIAPAVTITVKPNDPSNDTTPELQFTTGETATFECRIDGLTAFAACASPFEAPSLVDGSKTFRVRATDVVGNLGADTTFTWVVDTAAPTVVINTQPPAATNDNTPRVTFTPSGNPTLVECAVDAGTFAACTSPFDASTQTDGPHTITVRVTDAATNTNSATTGTFTVDTVIPTVSIDVEPSANSNDTTPTIQFSTTDNPTVVQCKIDTGGFNACTSPFTTGVLAPGNHTITVRVADAATNASTDVTATFVIDTAPPTIVINTEPLALSNNANPSITFTAGANPSKIECQVDTGTLVACTSPFTTAVTEGSHTITVKVTDLATNSATDTTAPFTVDVTAPTVSIDVEPAANSNDTTPTIQFSTTGSPTKIECQIDTGAFNNCVSPFSPTVTPATHTITVRVTDGATNSSTDTTAPFIVDTTPPTIVINTEPAALSNNANPSITFTAGGNPSKIECQLDTGSFANCTSPFTTAVVDGSHTITVRVTDIATNSATDTTAPFVVDTSAPTVTITLEPLANSNDTTPTIQFSTTGSPTKIECQIDSGAFANCTSPFSPTIVAQTAHTITVRVTDGATNSSTDTTAPFVIDTTAPTVSIDVEPAANSNNTSPSIQFSTAGNPNKIECQLDTGGFANCTSPFTITVTPGTHTITVRVTDVATNFSTDTTAPFVVDTAAPTVTIDTQPPALTNDNTPTVTFTTGGNPTTTECKVDNGTFVACSASFTPAVAVADGAHTITVHVVDAATNQASATTNNFTVDTTKPVVTFDDAPPAQWPVNYFDMKFHANETVTFTCSLNGAAFTSCSSPLTITTTYNVASTFSVRATDAATNFATATTNWTSTDGLVLHYAWEQGGTDNSSLLAQNAPYSPDGDVTTLPFVGGWAGTAAGFGVPLHHYKNTRRVLSSSAQTGNYTVGFWIRTNQDFGAGTLLSTLTATGGFEVSLQGNSLTTKVRETTSGSLFQASATIQMSRWCHVALHATGPGKGLDVFIDGSIAAHVAAPTSTGFENTQSNDLTVGSTTNPIVNLDLDDLRFFNRALSDIEMCTSLARGFTNPNNGCIPLSPGIELDFENNTLKDTGAWQLPLAQPQLISFINNTKTGGSMFLLENFPWGPAGGFNGNVNALPGGRSFSLWFVGGATATDLVDFRQQCNANSANQCGIRVTYDPSGKLNVFAGTDANIQASKSVGVTSGRHGVVITEQRTGNVTQTISVYVDGILKTTLAIGAGNVYANVSDAVHLVPNQNIPIDEFEFWPKDLTSDPEILCENGFDGLFVPADGSCLMTSN